METSVSGEKLIRVGSEGRDLFACISDYNGKPSVHIRYFMTRKRFPSKTGVALQPQEFQVLLDNADELKEQLKKLKKTKRLGKGKRKAATSSDSLVDE